ncbi:hypothetical protein Hanom_Chr08g00727921 [Helianthus anomalus]
MYFVFSSLFPPCCIRGHVVVTEENMAATRELGNNKRTGQQQVLTNFLLVLFQRPSLKRMLIRHAFEEPGQVEAALVKNKKIGQQQGMLTHVNIFLG